MIGDRTAEKIKIEVGAALPELAEPPADFAVQGRDLMTGIPKQITVSYTEIAHCLDKSISKIEEAILKALEITPPELSADIYQTGIYLTGGGALLRGLDRLSIFQAGMDSLWNYGLLLAFFGTVLPPVLFAYGMPKTGVSLGSILSAVELPVAVCMAYFVLHEYVSPLQFFGVVLILAVVVYINTQTKKD